MHRNQKKVKTNPKIYCHHHKPTVNPHPPPRQPRTYICIETHKKWQNHPKIHCHYRKPTIKSTPTTTATNLQKPTKSKRDGESWESRREGQTWELRKREFGRERSRDKRENERLKRERNEIHFKWYILATIRSYLVKDLGLAFLIFFF